MVRSFYLSWS